MRIILLSFLTIITVCHIIAQEVPAALENIISPEIHEDRIVTFRFLAPHADTVQITSDFLPTVKVERRFGLVDGPGKADLTKDENGLWSYTTEPLASEFYSYHFIVDGIRTNDPNNPYAVRNASALTNIFIIEEGQGDLYATQDIPHGTVAHRWYNSPGSCHG